MAQRRNKRKNSLPLLKTTTARILTNRFRPRRRRLWRKTDRKALKFQKKTGGCLRLLPVVEKDGNGYKAIRMIFPKTTNFQKKTGCRLRVMAEIIAKCAAIRILLPKVREKFRAKTESDFLLRAEAVFKKCPAETSANSNSKKGIISPLDHIDGTGLQTSFLSLGNPYQKRGFMKKIFVVLALPFLFSTQAIAKDYMHELENKIAKIEREYKEEVKEIEEKHSLSAEMKQLRLKQENEKKELKIKQTREKYELKVRQKNERRTLKQKERQSGT